MMNMENPSAESNPEKEESCPKCGHPKPEVKPGEPAPTECGRCGIIFSRYKPEAKSLPAYAPSEISNQTDASGTFKAEKAGFIARHKPLIYFISSVATVIIIVIAGYTFQTYRQILDLKNDLEKFDQQLNMNSKEQFEASLEKIQVIIEKTAKIVNRRLLTINQVMRFIRDADERFKRFLLTMQTIEDHKMEIGQIQIYGKYDKEVVSRNLCSGMHMTIHLIRDNNNREITKRFIELDAIKNNSKNYFNPKNSGYSYVLDCDPAGYIPSTGMILLRDGDEYVLREMTEEEVRAREKEEEERERRKRERAENQQRVMEEVRRHRQEREQWEKDRQEKWLKEKSTR